MKRFRPKGPRKSSGPGERVEVRVTPAADPYVTTPEAKQLAHTHFAQSRHLTSGWRSSDFLHNGVRIVVSSTPDDRTVVICLQSELLGQRGLN